VSVYTNEFDLKLCRNKFYSDSPGVFLSMYVGGWGKESDQLWLG